MGDDRLSEPEIWHLRFDVRDGVADPAEVKRLLRQFCGRVKNGEAIGYETLQFLAEAFQAYLDSTKKLDAALGLVRKRGAPPAEEWRRNRNAKIAYEMLRLRFEESKSYEEARAIVSDRFHVSAETARDAWTNCSVVAFTMLRLAWIEDGREMTKDDLARFAEIFENMAWFLPPGTGNSPNFLD